MDSQTNGSHNTRLPRPYDSDVGHSDGGSATATIRNEAPNSLRSSGKADTVNHKFGRELGRNLEEFAELSKSRPVDVLTAAIHMTYYRMYGTRDASIKESVASSGDTQGPEPPRKVHSVDLAIHQDTSLVTLVHQISQSRSNSSSNETTLQLKDASASSRDAHMAVTGPAALVLIRVCPDKQNGDTSFGASHYELQYNFYQLQNDLHAAVSFPAGRFPPVAIHANLSVLEEVLEQAIDKPEIRVSDLKFPLGGRGQLTSGFLVPEPAPYPREASVVDVLSEQVALNPSGVAVIDKDTQLTYSQLDQKSEDLAIILHTRYIKSGCLAPEGLVGVYAPRSCETIVAFFGILKAGLAYLPLDVNAPPCYTETILSSIPGMLLVLVGSSTECPPLGLRSLEFVTISGFGSVSRAEMGRHLPRQPTATSLAYAIFTSGSTGKPKGVLIEHRGIVRLVKNGTAVSELPLNPRIAHLSNIAFDASTWEVYAALANGGTVVCIDHATALDTRALATTMLQQAVQAACLTPGFLRVCAEQQPQMFTNLRLLLTGGDRLDPSTAVKVRRLIGQGYFYNVYGPTENTCLSTMYSIVRDINLSTDVPIGRSISNSTAYVVDQGLQLVPLGVIGELVVAGDGLARGYTESRLETGAFIQIDFDGRQTRAYRTGDRVRLRPNGQLQYIDRLDQQVKIRGHRVEVAEVERTLQRFKDVLRDAAVIACDLIDGHPEIFAFITPSIMATTSSVDTTGAREAEIAPLVGIVQRRLQKQLPSFMVPSTVVVLGQMPLNANGKVDRRELVKQARDAHRKRPKSPRIDPRNATEGSLCDLFCEVLGVPGLGVTDDFYVLGGHSLSAIKLAGRITTAMKMKASAADIFQNPIIADLAARLGSHPCDSKPIPQVDSSSDLFELSFAQDRLWFLEQLHPGTSGYTIPVMARLRGSLHLEALQGALLALEERHESLRTTFEDFEGTARQRLRPVSRRMVPVIDVSPQQDLDDLLRHEQRRPFDLSKECWRPNIFRCGPSDCVLSMNLHHIVADGWSIDVLCKELALLYSAAVRDGADMLSKLPPLPIRCRDFISWQRQQSETVEQQRQLEYWVQQLDGSRPAELVFDKVRPTVLSGAAGVVKFAIEGHQYRRVTEYAAAHKVTPFAVMLAAFRAAQYRLTGMTDATIGIPVANRSRQELEPLIGFFVNTQCIRTRIDSDTSFGHLVRLVWHATIDAMANQDVPFERVVAALQPGSREAARNPLVQMLFVLHSQERLGQIQLEGLTSEPIGAAPTTTLDLEVHLYQQPGGRLEGQAVFSEDVLLQTSMDSMLSVFLELLTNALDSPHLAIADVSLTTELFRSQTPDTRPVESKVSSGPSIIDLFREAVTTNSGNLAAKDSSRQLSYADLDQQSDRLADALRQRELAPETLVAIYGSRSCDVITIMLGVLKANLAYVPVDVHSPLARTETILSSIPGRTLVIVGGSVDLPNLPSSETEVVRVNELLSPQVGQSERTKPVSLQPSWSSLAYVIYTSGSTGTPKGVMIEHGGVVRLVKDGTAVSQLPPRPRVAHISNVAFDASVWEIYGALVNGGVVVCIDHADTMDTHALGNAFARERIQAAMFISPVHKACIFECPEALESLCVLHIGGEALSTVRAARARRILGCALNNVYGPTENTCLSTLFPITSNMFGTDVPIGYPIARSAAYVMDRQRRLLPAGVLGELVLTGDGIARGYTDATLDQDRFIEMELERRVVRAYRTGDLARLRPHDGAFEFRGRLDQQVKIRGYRVELAEAENAMLSCEHVSDAAVVTRNVGDAGLDLVGFATPFPRRGLSSNAATKTTEEYRAKLGRDIRRHLRARLPSYMVPAWIEVLHRMPLTTNGKIDRRALERQAATSFQQRGTCNAYIAPRTETEAALCMAVSDLLGLTSVGIEDNFFEMGGHSLLAMRLCARLSKELDTHVSTKDVFETPILKDLARKVTVASTGYQPISRLDHGEHPTGVSYAQGRLWFLDQLRPGAIWYSVPLAIRLRGPLHFDALSAAISAIECRHEVLRTTFDPSEGSVLQVVHPHLRRGLRRIDVAPTSVQDAIVDEQVRRFDLTAEPAWRPCLFRCSDEDHVLSIVLHHIVCDGWSIDILCRELSEFYSAALRNLELSHHMEAFAISYRDFAAWQRQEEQTSKHRKQLDYWREQLGDSRPAEFDLDMHRPAVLSGIADLVTFTIDEDLYARLRQCAASYSVTPFILLLAAFRAAHYRITRVQDATIGSPIANRHSYPELEPLVGLFVNTLCLRLVVDDESSFEALLLHTRQVAMEGFANQDVPFEQIVSELPGSRSVSRNPLVQILFAVHYQEMLGNVAMEGLSTEPVSTRPSTRLDAEMHLYHSKSQLEGTLIFSTELFKPATIRAFVSVFLDLLSAAIETPTVPVVELPLIRCIGELTERGLLAPVKSERVQHANVVDAFQQQAILTPDRIAVEDEATSFTYAQLNIHSDNLSNALRQRGFAEETLIGVYAPRACETIVAFLGILKANLAYLPLDINVPAGRTQDILDSVPGDKLVLVGGQVSHPIVRGSNVTLSRIADLVRPQTGNPGHAEHTKPHADSLAYVMYTSGSSGRPKGVMAMHSNILQRAFAEADLPAQVRVAHLSNLTFDATTWEVYTALLKGGTIVCIDYATVVDVVKLGQTVRSRRIQAAMITPGLLAQCLTFCPDALQEFSTLHVIGDQFCPKNAMEASSLVGGSLYNSYGPTENTILSTSHLVQPGQSYISSVPIGRPIPGTGAYVVDGKQRPMPLGVIGELVVTGDGVARGYLGSPPNQDPFVQISVSGNGVPVRAYRTGDLVKLRPADGQIEFIGRIDNQVKIHGRRVEVAEVERAILSHDLVRDAVVVARYVEDLGLELFGFIMANSHAGPPRHDTTLELEIAVKQHLQARLPSYMVPLRIAVLDCMPLNANGKIDRASLRQRALGEQQEKVETQLSTPRTQAEYALCSVFAELLHRPHVGPGDNFFDIGGHSLLAMRAVARLNKQLNLQASVKDIFDYPVIGRLSQKLVPNSVPYEPIPPTHAGKEGMVQLSSEQARLWFLEQLCPGQVGYTISMASRLSGALDLDALRRALLALQERHNTLRTTFTPHNVLAMQVIRPISGHGLRILDTASRSWQDTLLEEQSRPFDLSSEPGWRTALLNCGNESEYVLSIVMHHMVSDGWSVDVLCRDLATLYSAARRGEGPNLQGSLPPLAIDYRDYAEWQRTSSRLGDQDLQLEYWKAQLADSQPAEVPCDYARPAVLSGEAEIVGFTIDASDYMQLQRFATAHQVTPFVVLLAAFRTAHFRLTNAYDANIAIPVAGRVRLELESLVGMFVNTLCVRLPVEEKTTFVEFLGQAWETTSDAFAHQDVPFDRVVSCLRLKGGRDASRNPLVQLLFGLHPQEKLGEIQLEGVKSEVIGVRATTRLDLEFHLYQGTGMLRGVAVFSTDLYDISTVRNLTHVFLQVLRQGMNAPTDAIIDMPLVDTNGNLRERGLVAINDEEYPHGSSIVDLFAAQVAITPGAVAVRQARNNASLSYADLDEQSNRVAAWLRQRNYKAESVITVCAQRSCETIVAFLGILKAGLAYLPCDFRAPFARVREIISDMNAPRLVLLAGGADISLAEDVEGFEMIRTSDILLTQGSLRQFPRCPSTVPGPSGLAYVMCTSGSTGKAKGVMVDHRGIVRLFRSPTVSRQFPDAVRMAHFASLAFDASSWEIYAALLRGGTIVCLDQDTILDAAALESAVVSERIQAATITPSLLRHLCSIRPSALRTLEVLHIAGERLDRETAAAACSVTRGSVYNAYGPTEGSIASTIYAIPHIGSFSPAVPIGRPVSSRAYVMDRRQRVVPIGVIGELVIAGPGISRGYTDANQNRNKFIEVEIDGEKIKAYRTGDCARFRPKDTQLEFLGRLDLQVKVRGYRVEIAEVERAMLACLPVLDAAVVSQDSEGQNVQLVAFVVVAGGEHGRQTSSTIRRHLRRTLPLYMVPRWVKALPQMPLNTSGKIDRRELERLALLASSDANQPSSPTRIAPRTKMEALLCTSLAKLLDVPEVGATDHFFDLGGHSLMATRLVADLNRMNVRVCVKDVFDNPNLADLAGKLEADSTPYTSIDSLKHRDRVPMSFAQSRLWFLDQLHPGQTRYSMPLAAHLRGHSLSIEALEEAISALVQRHETLRTVFEDNDGAATQVVLPCLDKYLKLVDIPSDENAKAALLEDQTRPFDLRKEPGFRATMFRRRGGMSDEHMISIVLHHIVSDGWSVNVLTQDLTALYSAALRGLRGDALAAQLNPLPVQYRAFSEWQRQGPQVEEHERQLGYWIEELKDSKPAELLLDGRVRPAILSGKAGVVEFTIQDEVYDQLQDAAAKYDATLFMLLLTVFRATHYRLTGATDATMGSPIAGRTRKELEGLIGFFVNMLCLRVHLDEDSSFETLVRQVRFSVVRALANQDVPFESIVSRLRPNLRDASRNPLVQLIFAFHPQAKLGHLELEGLVSEPIQPEATSRMDLEFHVFQESGRLECTILYSAELYEPCSVRGMVKVFQELLTGSLHAPTQAIVDLPLSTGVSALRERDLLVVSAASEYPRDDSIIDVFSRQVSTAPDAVAVKQDTTQMTYSQLDVQSTALAIGLRRWQFAPETLVAVYAQRTCETLVIFLGILKAGLAYLPLDIHAPVARMEGILSSVPSTKLVIVGHTCATPECKLPNVELTKVENIVRAIRGPDGRNADSSILQQCKPTAESLAYVIFTSGSTGKPKGVMVQHRGIVRLVKDGTTSSQLPPTPRLAHLTNLSFDASVLEIYTALLNGGTAICVEHHRVLNPKSLHEFEHGEVDGCILTPAFLRLMLEENPAAIAGLKALWVAGEVFPVKDAAKADALLPNGVYNAYGPTENSVLSTIWCFDRDQRFPNGLPIGRPIRGSGALVLDRQLRRVPMGVVGELVVTGDGVARGYTDPALDVGQFAHVMIDGQFTRAYRTGDRVRYRYDGELEFLGRVDQQVHIRGHRVELAEVEHAVISSGLVADVAVVTHHVDDLDKSLLVYVTAATSIQSSGQEEDTQVHDWSLHFDSSIFSQLDSIPASEIGCDFVGWKSMFDGNPFNNGHMQEWLEDTIDTLLDGRRPGHVLEIGPGTGMVLFNIGPGLKSYIGIEPSREAAAFLRAAAGARPELKSKVRIVTGSALDIQNMHELSPNLVVLNSVIQYFPSQQYLLDVLAGLLRLTSVERIVIGDVRPYTLNDQFMASRALHDLGSRASKDDIAQAMTRLVEQEEELLVDPGFFTSLRTRYPDVVAHVEILPKKMRASNELSAYRYAVVLHVNRSESSLAVEKIDEQSWYDFQALGLDASGLQDLLRTSTHDQPIAIGNIPGRRTIFEKCLLDETRIARSRREDTVDWLTSVSLAAQAQASLAPDEVIHMGKMAGFRTEISWARQASSGGAFDVVFHRSTAQASARVLFDFPLELPSPGNINAPLQRKEQERIASCLRKQLEMELPSYMIPSCITVLDRMPINSSGKVDRQELKRRSRTSLIKKETTAKRVLPHGKMEILLCSIVAEVLGIEAVGITDNFFEVGGHSLMATRLVARLNKRLDVDVSVTDVFDCPVLGDLAQRVDPGSVPYTPIPQVKHQENAVELSFAQSRMWFLEQLRPGDVSYSVPFAARFLGHVQLTALERAVRALRQRHETLRTTFEQRKGVAVQVVHDHIETGVRVERISGQQRYTSLVKEQRRRFDLTKEPGFRLVVFRSEEDDILSIVMHHIISDGWSIELVCRELTTLYSAALRGQDPSGALGPLPNQYRDFAAWQRQSQADERRAQLRYWLQQLEGSSAASFLQDYARPAAHSGKADVVEFTIGGPVCNQVHEFARHMAVTPFVVLLTAFRAVHYRMTGSTDATIGTPVANRHRQELENIIGFFANTQCIRIPIDEQQSSFATLVHHTRRIAADAFANQDVPFEQIVSELHTGPRSLSHNPLVQTMFALHTQEKLGQIQLPGLEMESLSVEPTTRFDLELHLQQSSGAFEATILFSTDLFAMPTVQAIASIFQELLVQGIERPGEPIANLPLNTTPALQETPQESHLPSGITSAYPRDSSIVDLFSRQAALLPTAMAIRDGTVELTYQALSLQAEQVAISLCIRKLTAETLVGVYAPRSCETIVAFLGILKAGLAYLPLSVDAPLTYTQSILSSSQISLLLVNSKSVFGPADFEGIEVIRIDDAVVRGRDVSAVDTHRSATLLSDARPSATSLAYSMFTSGSTGTPKGVLVEHRSVIRLVTKHATAVSQLPPAPIVAHLSNIAFDASIWEIYGTLLSGGTLICIESVVDLDSLSMTMIRERIQAAVMTPALLQSCLQQCPHVFAGLDLLLSGGDRLDASVATKVNRLVRGSFSNVYGPTENTCLSTLYTLPAGESVTYPNGVPIGRAIAHTGAYVVDAEQRLVPPGVVGELIVTGDGLARGYTDASLNRGRFIWIDDGAEHHMRAYRTGDRVRARPLDGQLEFFGRVDRQVKIRGHRVELAEIERTLLGCPGVDHAAVIARDSKGVGRNLVAFVTRSKDLPRETSPGVHQRDRPTSSDDVRHHLHTQLPTYMMPTSIISLDHMPLNANSKVDWPELHRQARAKRPPRSTVSIAPRNGMEVVVCRAFADALGLDEANVGATDDFFGMGGHSLMVTRVATYLTRHLEKSVGIKDVFEHPVAAALSRHLLGLPRFLTRQSNLGNNSYAPFDLVHNHDSNLSRKDIATELGVEEHRVCDAYPATQVQSHYLRDARDGGIRPLIPFRLNIPPALSNDQLRESCHLLIQRHDIFRTVFVSMHNRLHQVVLDHIDVDIEFWETRKGLDAAADEVLDSDLRHPLRLGRSVFRIATVRDECQNTQLLFRMSHALYDGLSFQHMANTLWAALTTGDLPKAIPFSCYMRHMNESRTQGYQYWRNLLRGSTMTIMHDNGDPEYKVSSFDDFCTATRLVPASLTDDSILGVTQANVFTAACALLLAEESRSKDVLFGRAVSGRQGLPLEHQSLIGPCVNTAPTRVHVEGNSDMGSVLRQVQQQYVDGLPFQTLGFDDIKTNCTTWSSSIHNYWCAIAYHHFPTGGIVLQQSSHPRPPPVHDLELGAIVISDGTQLEISAKANPAYLSANATERILRRLCELIGILQRVNTMTPEKAVN